MLFDMFDLQKSRFKLDCRTESKTCHQSGPDWK